MVMAMLLYFPGGMFSTYFGFKASAEGITLTEPQKDGNGVYQIGKAAELYWFADKINNDNENYKSINAVRSNPSPSLLCKCGKVRYGVTSPDFLIL